MNKDEEKIAFHRHFLNAVFIPGILVLIMVLSRLLQSGMDWDFYQFGILPRRPENLWSIFTVVFVHADWSHLANNAISFFVLSSLLFYFYRVLAMRVLLLSWFFSGLLLWLIGRDSCHVGASGWIYAIAFFLFFSGLFRKMASVTSISFIVALMYGSMVWHIFPWELHDPVSWEGHLAGGVTGLFLAVIFRNKPPQPLPQIWDEEEGGDEEPEESEAD